MAIFERVFHNLISYRERIVKGLTNCIPSPFPRFRAVFPGFEKGKYILVTANSKVGKTQITDFMAVYEPIFEAIDKGLHVRWFYFTFEMSVEQKYIQFLCYLLFKLSGQKIRLDSQQLRSINLEKLLPQEAIELLQTPEYQKYITYFEEHVTFIDDVRHPTGIKEFLQKYASSVGTTHFTSKIFKDNETHEEYSRSVFDYYEPNDPELYNIVIIDHISLLTQEKGLDLRSTIELLSSKYLVQLRNRYKFTFVVVQQQAASQEGTENFKLDKLKPSADGLGECKTTWRDVDIFMGLYAPHRYNIPTFLKYNIAKFGDNIRFLELIGGREGGGKFICPLYFDGAVNFFKELPPPTEEAKLEVVYNKINAIRQNNKVIVATLLVDPKQKTTMKFKFIRIWAWLSESLGSPGTENLLLQLLILMDQLTL